MELDYKEIFKEFNKLGINYLKGMKTFDFYNRKLPIGEIDIIIYSPISYESLKERAVRVPIQEISIPIVSIHDLIELKLRAGRKQDLSDVEYLKLILEK